MIWGHFRNYLNRQGGYLLVAFLLFVAAMALPPFQLFADRAPSMLALHLVLELFAVLVAGLVVVAAWHEHKFQHRSRTGVLIAGFAVIAFLDLVHALTYDGMPRLITEASTTRAVNFWLWGRTAVALTLGAYLLGLRVPLSRRAWALLAAVICLVLFNLGSWHLDLLPEVFIPGQGTTLFKRLAEYALSLCYLLLGLGYILQGARGGGEQRTGRHNRSYGFATACLVMAMGELVFSNYRAPSDFLNIFGHVFKVIGYAFLYDSIFVAAIRDPYLKLQGSEERFRMLTDLSVDAYWEQDRQFHFVQVSRDVGGVEVRSMMGRARWEMAVQGGADFWEAHRRTLERHEAYRDFVYQATGGDGSIRTLASSGQPRYDDHGEFIGYIGVSRDITDQQAAKQHLEFLAYHDPLTGLPNHRLLHERFVQHCGPGSLVHGRAAVLQLDLDNFKSINDTLGHQAGDALLREVARRLMACAREVDVISRQGGDEFSILLPGLRHADELALLVAAIMDTLQQPMVVLGQELSTSASLGVAVYPDDGRDLETLRLKAEVAMYQAKQAGRNTSRYFDSTMNSEASEHLSLRNGLTRALERGELALHYQPQVHLATGEVIGVEALLRWNHPERGMIAPARFIPVAEDSGLIVPIGVWVLREACRQGAQWMREGLPAIAIAVNLSAVQFKRGDVEQSVQQALDESGLPPHLLELELTESILIQNTESVIACLHRLKQMGVKLSIDDFGTGYSSLSYLKRFDIDKLKIDQSFVRDLETDPDDAAIVRAIVQMAHSLNLKTIAEGVETLAMATRLKAYGCDDAQGYLYSRPVSAAEATAFLRRAGLPAELMA